MCLVLILAALSVSKLSEAMTAENADIRLVNGDDLNQGRLEVLYNNEWGTVCDKIWSSNDARVACHQLGLPNDEVLALDDAYFERGTGPAWLSDLQCDGKEDVIVDCSHDGWSRHDCGHENDAGLYCSACSKPYQLGIQSDDNVKDAQITASSEYPGYEAYHARLGHDNYWSAFNGFPNPWIQVDFLSSVTITKIFIQGSGSFFGYNAYVEKVEIQTGDFEYNLKYIKEDGQPKTFTANDDRSSVVELEFDVPVSAQLLRINPVKCKDYCALRFDVEGCSSVNECDNNHPCDLNATCTDLNDGYQCRCKQGYVGNGFQCRPTEIPTTMNNPTMETTQDTSIISISPKAVPNEKANTTMTNIGLIVGAAIGGIVLILLTLLLIWCICRYRRSTKTVVITETHNNELGVLDTHAQSLVGNIYNGINDQNTPRRDNTYAEPDQHDENPHDNTPRRDNTYAEPDQDDADLQASNSHQSNLRRDNTYALIDQINSNLDGSNSHTPRHDQTNANSQDSNTHSPRRDNTYAQPDQDHPNSTLNELHNPTHDIIYADPDQNEQNPQDHPRIPNQGDVYANTDPDQANSHLSTTPNIHGHEVVPDLMPRYAHVSKPKKQTSDSLDDNTPHQYVNVQISDNSSEPLLATSESGWMDNTLYASSKDRDGGQQSKTSVTMATEQVAAATRYSEKWMDNSLYDTSEEYNGSKQNTQEAQEGWVDNSIYDI